MRWAATLRGLQMTGYKFGQRVARLWHQTIGLTFKQLLKEKLDAFLQRRLFIPVFKITDQSLKRTIKTLKSYKPKLIDGYAEAFNVIAKYNNKVNGKPIGVDSIMTSAQTLSKTDRDLISTNLDSKVFDKYGSREFSGIAYQCEAHQGYHVVAENYIVEIIKDGKPAKPGEIGEIIITEVVDQDKDQVRRLRIGAKS